MRAFAAGEIDVLVSTTVIEVGVDVHNATAMVLLDADRFGVSQLHQLRGRVGRAACPGCACWSPAPRPARPPATGSTPSPPTTDGFELSRIDLEQRREGDVLGPASRASAPASSPAGAARREDDRAAREAAEALLSDDPDARAHPDLAAAVAEVERSAAGSEFMEKG